MTYLQEYENKFDLNNIKDVPYECLYEIQEAARNTMKSVKSNAMKFYKSDAYYTYMYAKKIVQDIENEFNVRDGFAKCIFG